jgi:hypothetical protein
LPRDGVGKSSGFIMNADDSTYVGCRYRPRNGRGIKLSSAWAKTHLATTQTQTIDLEEVEEEWRDGLLFMENLGESR